MYDDIRSFQKSKEYLVCVDSDGCVFDTMDSKHILCFAPSLAEVWDFGERAESVVKRWNDVNLYTMNRGMNRFKALAVLMRELHESGMQVGDVTVLEKWITESPELSEPALVRDMEKYDSEILRKTLSWSRRVNKKIKELPEDARRLYDGAAAALQKMHMYADVVIVSTANRASLEDDWGRSGLLQHVDLLLDQNSGSKEYCIRELLKKGYDKDKVIMIGDAPGDYRAAVKNEVFFYPILVRYEEESWKEFRTHGFECLLSGHYGGAYQTERLSEFRKNLDDL